jgi:hypothetical protein
MAREPKKTDFLEVRLAWETKRAFMTKCRENGVSASRLVRAWIARDLASASRAPKKWKEQILMLFTGRSRRGRAAIAALVLFGPGLALATFAGSASAAADPRIAALFDWIDSDNDGRVSQAEFGGATHRPEARPDPFGAIELVVDTRIPPPPGESRRALFARLDVDRDGALVLGELDAGAVARTIARPDIEAADANHDGALTEGELAAYGAARRTAAGDPNASEGASLLARGILLEHDRDGDGKILVMDLLERR